MTTNADSAQLASSTWWRLRRWYANPPTGAQWRGSSAFRGRRWHVPATVAAITAVAGVVSGWNWGHRSFLGYYTDAARSMSSNWRAFFFGSFDPGATITLDKLSGFIVPQALSIRMFGFHSWSIALPQISEGLITVVAAYVIGARWKGIACGLLAAAAVTTTPLLAAMFGRGVEDCMLTMSLTLAFLCWQSSILGGRLRPLMFAAVWIGIGFQAKMMQAWLILPPLVLVYLMAAPHPLGQRIRRMLLMVGMTVVLSLSWITAIMLVPAGDRPYIDGSTDNNGYAMVFGYNGFNRIVPNLIPGAVGDTTPPPARSVAQPMMDLGTPAQYVVDRIPTATPTRLTLPPVAVPRATAPLDPGLAAEGSKAKLVDAYFLTQIGWYYPLALAGLIFAFWPVVGRMRSRALRPRKADVAVSSEHNSWPDPDTATAAALGLWLAVAATFLTIVRIPHTAYLSAIGIQVALLAAGGLSRAIAIRVSNVRAARLVLPALVAVQALWAVVLLLVNGQAPGWILPAVASGGVASALLLIRARPGPSIAVVAAVGAVLLAPSIWTGFVMTKSDTSESDPYAGPHPQAAPVGSVANQETDRSYGFNTPFSIPPDPKLSQAQRHVVDYVRSHPGASGPMMATDLWGTAENYIEVNDLSVVPFGGFSGTVATPTVDQLAEMVTSGRLRFVLLHVFSAADVPYAGGINIDGGGYALFEGPPVLQLRTWVQAHCVPVPVAAYTNPQTPLRAEKLYVCSPSRA